MATPNLNRQMSSASPAAQSFFPSFSPTTQSGGTSMGATATPNANNLFASTQAAFNAGVAPSRARWQEEQDLEDEMKRNAIIKQRMELGLPIDASLLPKSSQDTINAARLYAQKKAETASTKGYPTNYF